ncbi:hypothetical protein LCGC14_1537660 [marine sediment metagenome]|uniref:Carbohydrate-binding domain-containing protein n=1 Tax=marine sediment metagenome TaxID=412755 RepID=A0A0F9IU51_9ZZZZ
MAATRERLGALGTAVVIAAMGAFGLSCSESKRPPRKPVPPTKRTVKQLQPTPPERPAPKPAATEPAPASAPAIEPTPKPAPWTKVRKVTLDESFAVFTRLHKVSILRVPKVARAPAIDGRLDEAYKKAKPLTLRFLDARTDKPTAPTTVHVVSTDAELFVFYQCTSPNADALRATITKHDGDVWQDESIEMFLDPGNLRRMETYLHVVVNPLGTTMEAKSPKSNAETGWNPKLRVKTVVGKRGWIMEMALPLADLTGTPGRTPRVWAANFNRMARLPDSDEDTAWCPTGGEDSHVPAYFGLLWLEAGNVYTDYARWTGPRHSFGRPGKAMFRFVEVPPETLAKCKDLTPNADKTCWFGLGKLSGAGDSLVVLSDDKAVRVSSLHSWRPIQARWLNAKLLYITRQMDDTEGYYCIYDVPVGKVVVEETYNDGTRQWDRVRDKLRPAK